MFNLFIKLQFIASRNWVVEWDKDQKILYIKQNVDRVALHKQLTKLRIISVYQKVLKEKQMNMKSNMQDMITDDQVKKRLHDNAFE